MIGNYYIFSSNRDIIFKDLKRKFEGKNVMRSIEEYDGSSGALRQRTCNYTNITIVTDKLDNKFNGFKIMSGDKLILQIQKGENIKFHLFGKISLTRKFGKGCKKSITLKRY